MDRWRVSLVTATLNPDERRSGNRWYYRVQPPDFQVAKLYRDRGCMGAGCGARLRVADAGGRDPLHAGRTGTPAARL
jgi:hypothetical protein